MAPRKAVGVASDTVLSVRVPADFVRRADALILTVAAEGIKHGQTHASRSLVIKRAIEEGLKVLEGRHGRSGR
jgi:hypothetical protein